MRTAHTIFLSLIPLLFLVNSTARFAADVDEISIVKQQLLTNNTDSYASDVVASSKHVISFTESAVNGTLFSLNESGTWDSLEFNASEEFFDEVERYDFVSITIQNIVFIEEQTVLIELSYEDQFGYDEPYHNRVILVSLENNRLEIKKTLLDSTEGSILPGRLMAMTDDGYMFFQPSWAKSEMRISHYDEQNGLTKLNTHVFDEIFKFNSYEIIPQQNRIFVSSSASYYVKPVKVLIEYEFSFDDDNNIVLTEIRNETNSDGTGQTTYILDSGESDILRTYSTASDVILEYAYSSASEQYTLVKSYDFSAAAHVSVRDLPSFVNVANRLYSKYGIFDFDTKTFIDYDKPFNGDIAGVDHPVFAERHHSTKIGYWDYENGFELVSLGELTQVPREVSDGLIAINDHTFAGIKGKFVNVYTEVNGEYQFIKELELNEFPYFLTDCKSLSGLNFITYNSNFVSADIRSIEEGLYEVEELSKPLLNSEGLRFETENIFSSYSGCNSFVYDEETGFLAVKDKTGTSIYIFVEQNDKFVLAYILSDELDGIFGIEGSSLRDIALHNGLLYVVSDIYSSLSIFELRESYATQLQMFDDIPFTEHDSLFISDDYIHLSSKYLIKTLSNDEQIQLIGTTLLSGRFHFIDPYFGFSEYPLSDNEYLLELWQFKPSTGNWIVKGQTNTMLRTVGGPFSSINFYNNKLVRAHYGNSIEIIEVSRPPIALVDNLTIAYNQAEPVSIALDNYFVNQDTVDGLEIYSDSELSELGLIINDAVLEGTSDTFFGMRSVVISAKNEEGKVASFSLNIDVNRRPQLLSQPDIIAVLVNESFVSDLSAYFYDESVISLTISDSLPEGISFDGTSISGSIATTGEYIFTLTAIDRLGAAASVSISIKVDAPLVEPEVKDSSGGSTNGLALLGLLIVCLFRSMHTRRAAFHVISNRKILLSYSKRMHNASKG
jgi:hypothetical protein